MLERPSNIFERIRKCYMTFLSFLKCYNVLYVHVISCSNRPNISLLTWYITYYMTCLNGLLRPQIQIYISQKMSRFMQKQYCVKSVRIRSYSGPYFLAFRMNTERDEVSPLGYQINERSKTLGKRGAEHQVKR